MKRTFLLGIIVLAAVQGCSPKAPADPFREALMAKLVDSVEPGAKILLFNFERIDSTTVSRELEYRIGVFDKRLSQNEKFLKEFLQKNMQKNTGRKLTQIQQDKKVIAGLDSLKEVLAGCKDSIVYYDYAFSGRASGKETETEFKDWYASISPDAVILSMSPARKDLHKALGATIPGYSKLVRPEMELTDSLYEAVSISSAGRDDNNGLRGK